jgi:CubicO group peptidase (beta-lactamase class C family)
MKKSMISRGLRTGLLAGVFAGLAAVSVAQEGDRMPVSVAKQGFPFDMPQARNTRIDMADALSGGDTTLFSFMNMSQFMPTTFVPARGPAMPLVTALRPQVGRVVFDSPLGRMSLDDFITHPDSYVQGYLVIQKGRIVYEQYPGMRPQDAHVWASNAKVLTSLVVGLLVDAGKIDPARPMGDYMPDFADTAWAEISVQDVLDMATGLDVVENDETRADPNSIALRLFNAEFGLKNANGVIETHNQVLKSAKKIGEPGQAFEYASGVTQMLVLLAEAVDQKRWANIVDDRIWSKMGVEGALQVHLSPDGIAAAHGLLSSRLRDLGRFGMLYVPSWDKAAHEQVVTAKMIDDIQNGCRPEIFDKGHLGPAMTRHFKTQPKCNGWQWDAIFDDGDFYKSGLMGQGIYVSPARDLVVVWFSTNKAATVTGYSRAIATSGLFDE